MSMGQEIYEIVDEQGVIAEITLQEGETEEQASRRVRRPGVTLRRKVITS